MNPYIYQSLADSVETAAWFRAFRVGYTIKGSILDACKYADINWALYR